MSFRAVKGMNDILPDEVALWQRLESTFRRVVELCGYEEVRTPVVEGTELFVRSIGETTDVVEKEMYTFDRHRESLTLRPEGTAGAARAYVEHKVYSKQPVSRWYYLGPMFRAERPQRGRYRQFYQAGCEIFGDPGPACDAEMLDMLVALFRSLGIGDLTVHVNSLGGPGTRERYRDALLAYLSPKKAALSEHAQARLEKNPLRILDSKDPRDQEACRGAPSILELLDEPDRKHWDGLCAALDVLGTPYTVDAGLVRGLDYYTRTLFELRSGAGELELKTPWPVAAATTAWSKTSAVPAFRRSVSPWGWNESCWRWGTRTHLGSHCAWCCPSASVPCFGASRWPGICVEPACARSWTVAATRSRACSAARIPWAHGLASCWGMQKSSAARRS